jgi:two-component system chemotaxis response regulator CheB
MRKIRIVVIDDSAFNRRTIIRLLEELPEVEVVGYAANGEEGLRRVIDLRPDLITLDLEMPGMDGFTLLRIIMNSIPTPVIVVSAQSEDERVFKAMELGAVDFVAKPGRVISDQLLDIRVDLQRKVTNVFNLNLKSMKKRELAETPRGTGVLRLSTKSARGGKNRFDLVAIGSSTGGPPALQKILSQFPEKFPFAVLISQHMPAGFTKAFAERLNRMFPFTVQEAVDGDEVLPNSVLIAPGGKNLTVVAGEGKVFVRLQSPTKEDKYVPSVNVMFASVAQNMGAKVLGVVLTGMGNDGSQGVRFIKEAGGVVMAESEETSVVFGMPREAIATGLVDKVVPLEQMAGSILEYCGFTAT